MEFCEECGGDSEHGSYCICEYLEQRRARGYCETCGGDSERGYACVWGDVYRPDNCPEITGRF